MTRTVAALYIDPRGPYPSMPDVDCWDETRDAREYIGPYPVVAHPPCGPWCKQRHNYQGTESDCGPRAVEQVRLYGGVLEQPSGSKLWDRCGLPRPITGDDWVPARHDWYQDQFAGWAVEVAQVSWGHPCRKPTWLYFVGIASTIAVLGRRTGGVPTHWCSGGRKRSSGRGGLIPHGVKAASAQIRRRTPPAFAEWLVSLARSVALP